MGGESLYCVRPDLKLPRSKGAFIIYVTGGRVKLIGGYGLCNFFLLREGGGM